MLARHERGDIVHRQGVDQGLIGLGIIAFILDEGELGEVPDEVFDPLPDGRQGGGNRVASTVLPS